MGLVSEKARTSRLLEQTASGNTLWSCLKGMNDEESIC